MITMYLVGVVTGAILAAGLSSFWKKDEDGVDDFELMLHCIGRK